jgi:hypothetical protein
MRATRRASTLPGICLAAVLALLLALPAASQAARPNYGAWDSMDWSQDFGFTVNKKGTYLSSFNPNWQDYWTLTTGEQVWTQVSGLSARISGGWFESTSTMTVGGLNRTLTATLSGHFYSRTRASGTLTQTLSGASAPQTVYWDAYGPERHKKKKKIGHPGPGGGGGGGNGETCQIMWDPILGFHEVCLPN